LGAAACFRRSGAKLHGDITSMTIRGKPPRKHGKWP
jgi:hypothetical protein